MAIKDFGKGLKSSLHDAVDTVKAKAKEVELPDIKAVSYTHLDVYKRQN